MQIIHKLIIHLCSANRQGINVNQQGKCYSKKINDHAKWVVMHGCANMGKIGNFC